MGENGARHEEARGPTRRRLCCTPFQNFSQRERDVEECHRRVGRVGPEYQSSRRGRGEQRRPLRRRVGNMGACPPPLRGRSAVLSPNAAMYLFGQTIEPHIDFDLTGAWRHHVSMRPSSRSQSAATTALRKVHGELFRVKRLREIPQWWILGRCLPPTSPSLCRRRDHEPRAQFRLPPLPPVGRPSRAGGKRRAEPSTTSRRAHVRSKGRRPARRLPPLSQPLPATGSRT